MVKQKNKKEKIEIVNNKDDGIFRIFMKTNSMKNEIIYRIELPSNEVFENNYGNLVKYEVMEDYENESFELYLDGQLKGMYTLLEANKFKIKYEKIEV